MGILFNRLLQILNTEKQGSTYYVIAMTMLQNYQEIHNIPINVLADRCCASKSTISKFIRHMGYEDYQDFRYSARIGSDTPYGSAYGGSVIFQENVIRYLATHSYEEYVQTLIDDIKSTYDSLDMAAVDRLTRDIYSYKKVAAFGLMFSESAAMDLQIKLYLNQKFIITYMKDQKQLEYIRNAKEDTLIIIFSESGNYLKQYESVITDYSDWSVFRETHAKIVLITSNEEALKSKYISYGISLCHTSELRTHRITFQVLTDILAYKYYEYRNSKI